MKQRLLMSLLFVCCLGISTLWAQQFHVTGKVSDASTGAGIPGVSIHIKGTNTGTSTNSSGTYTLSVDAQSILSISAVGYYAKEVPVGNRQQLHIDLSSIAEALDEVIVVAYGTAKKSTYTGSASSLGSKNIKDNPAPSFEQALTGRLAGVQVNASSGQAGSTASIRVRGIGSMNASNEPLYVVDGVPVVSGDPGQMSDKIMTSNNVMNSINPADIESITVLKDAAASALYGSRAANGVVMITTKRGQSGAPKLNFKSSIGFTPSWATENYKPASVQDQIDYNYRIFHDYRTSNGDSEESANAWTLNRLNSRFGIHGYEFSTAGFGLNESVNIKGKTDGLENRDGRYFNWEDALFRTGIFQTNDISVSGATELTNYYSSLSYTKDKGRAVINEFERIGGRVNLTQKLHKNVEFGSNINISHNSRTGFNDTRNTATNYFYQVSNLLFPLYWPTDYKTGNPWTTRYNSYGQNNIYYNEQWENSSNTLRLSAIESLTVQILPELTAKTIFSFDNTEIKDHLYYSPLHYNGITTNGSVDEYSTQIRKLVSSSTLNYNKQFGRHNLGILAGFEAEKNQTNFQRSSGTDLPSSSLHTVATAGVLDASAYFWGGNMLSALSRVEYNFDEKYFLSGSFRRDGSSRLGPDSRWGNFWSVAGSWNLKKEAFLQPAEALSNLRLRASYGVNGTLPDSNYGWRSLSSYGSKYMESAGGIISTIADPNLSWETSYTYNLAAEFGFFQDRLTGSIEYFSRDSKNLLQSVNISTVTGFESTLKNIGNINNSGLEFNLAGDIIRQTDFRWSASINGSFINSKVISLSEGKDITWFDPTGRDNRVRFIYREGESVLSFYTKEWAGVDQTNGKPIWYTNDGTEGDFLFNGRGATNSVAKAQQTITGSAIPKVFGGINTEFAYKSFSLGFNFMYKLGGKLYDAGSTDVAEDGYYWERIRSQYAFDDAWSIENPNGTLPKISGNDPEDGIEKSSRHLHSASFIRLKNINLAYTIPSAALNRIGLSNARLFFNGTNLLTFSKFKYADPEVNQYGTRGWETPFGKTYTFGIEIGL